MKIHLLSDKRKIVGWIDVATAVVSATTIIFITGMLSSSEGFSFWILLIVIVPLLYLIAGVGVLKNKNWALFFSVILQILAVFDISIGDNFSWNWEPGLALSFSITVGDVSLGIDFLAAWKIYLLVKLIAEERAKQAI